MYTGSDWLEKEWYYKLINVMNDDDANMLCVVMAAMERDATVRDKIRTEGFAGFTRWLKIRCKDIYYKIQSALESIWQWIKSKFNF